MLNYELAKKLKEAGYPTLKGWDDTYSKIDGVITGEYDQQYIPTLSELIDACEGHVSLDWYPKSASAYATCCDRNDHQQHGSTPEEAVANLYLSLHGKKD